MLASRLRDPAMLAAGVFTNVRLDAFTGNLAQQGTPAIVADVLASAGVPWTLDTIGTLAGTWVNEPQGLYGNTFWPNAMGTATAGSTWTLTTSAYAVELQYVLQGVGAIAHVTVDGQPWQALNTATVQRTPYRIYLDGQPHTIVVTYTGDAILGTALLDPPTDVSGTAGLAAALGCSRNGQPVLGETWTVQATSGTQVEVKDGGGTVRGTLAEGNTSDALIPGVTLSLSPGTWDATSIAQIITVAPGLMVGATVLYDALASNATYVGPVLDAGRTDTEWPLLEYAEGPIQANTVTMQRGAGDTAIPDGSWTWQVPSTRVWPDPDGGDFQRVLNYTPGLVGRYSQTIATFTGSARTWVSDITVFSWQPATDPFRQRLNPTAYKGPTRTVPMVMAHAAIAALQYQDALDFTTGFAPATATGSYLTTLGQQFNTPRLNGEADAQYRARLTLMVAGRNDEGSEPFLRAALSGAFGCPVVVAPLPRSSSGMVFGSFVLGTRPFGRSAHGYRRWQVQIPIDQLQIPPETAQQIVEQLRPVGSVVSILFV